MKYKFSKALDIDYTPLERFVPDDQELTKAELLERCSGEISFDLLQCVKELEFDAIGKEADGSLYLR